jgi:bacterial/archaeal transporter family-2 protein
VTALAVVLVVAGGIGGAIQAALMGRFGERVGTLEAFAFATLLTAFIGAAILLVGRGSLAGYGDAARQPVWLWTAAAMSALIVLGITFAAPRIGTTAAIGIIVAGNLAMAAVIDRFGLFGLERIPLSTPRLAGILLLAAGAALSLHRA